MSHLVSIITPAWNAARYLTATHESLKAQTHADWEWLVADDGSTDGTAALLARLAAADPRVKPLGSVRTGLPAAGRNRGIAAAKGDYIALLDADDLCEPTRLADQLAMLAKDPAAALTYSFIDEFWSEEEVRGTPPTRAWAREELAPDEIFPALLRRGNMLCTSTLLFRRSLLEAVGTFDEDPGLRGVEDHEWILRVAARHRIVRTPGLLVRYRIHGGNTTKSIRLTQLEALKTRLESGGLLSGEAGRMFLSGYHYIRGEAGMLGLVEGMDFRGELLRAIRLEPGNPLRWVGLMGVLLPRAVAAPLYRGLKRLQARLAGDRAMPHTATSNH